MNNYLEVNDLAFHYSSGFSFKSKSFFMKQGEIVALLGESGSGKTTFLRLLAGLLTPKSGKIVLDQSVLYDKKTYLEPYKRKIGFVFQDYALFPHLTVRKNIEFAFKAVKKNFSLQDIMKELEWTGLFDCLDRYPAELSGGQQQRVALIRSLVSRPKLLLMDEPFVGLDVSLRKKVVFQTIKTLRHFGMTGLIVTHNPIDVESLIDRVEHWNSL